MKHIITALIAIACIVAGGVGGHFLRSGSAKPAGEAHGDENAGKDHGKEKSDSHGKSEKADAHGKDAKAKGGDHGKEGAGASQTIYYKFSREFVVPVIRNNHVNSLVILHLSIEADSSISQKLFEMEPKLRDNIMTTLITISNDGRTFENLTDVESYESMRSLILMNLKTVVPSGISNVLIMDMARQDV
ncbi:flagellar basal body-associated FliL family protein [Hyphomonas sp.]|uniref:flagellar basal body-associated FliL family protein n=1 Tax=Hyphomonas sp. TaxID=87 RepID=UPI00391B7329